MRLRLMLLPLVLLRPVLLLLVLLWLRHALPLLVLLWLMLLPLLLPIVPIVAPESVALLVVWQV